MIVDRPGSHFIFLLPWDHMYRHYNYIKYNGKDLTNKEYLDYWGKWILFGTRTELDELASKLDPFVEHKAIPAVKYDREIIPEFAMGRCVMCVFCDSRERENVWEILEKIGVDSEKKAWVFERETIERWLPGGHLLETWIKGRNFGEEEAEKVRKSSKEKFAKMFENENAIFRGIDQ